MKLLLCSISTSTWIPSGCQRNWSSNIIIDLNTLWKWWLMVSPERQKKKDIVQVFTLCDIVWRNLATCSSTVARCVSWNVSSQNVTQTLKSLWTHAYYIIAFFTKSKSMIISSRLCGNVGNTSFQLLPSMNNVAQITA